MQTHEPKKTTMHNQSNDNPNSPFKNEDKLEDPINNSHFEEETSNVTAGFIDLATYDELENYLFKSTDETS